MIFNTNTFNIFLKIFFHFLFNRKMNSFTISINILSQTISINSFKNYYLLINCKYNKIFHSSSLLIIISHFIYFFII